MSGEIDGMGWDGWMEWINGWDGIGWKDGMGWKMGWMNGWDRMDGMG